MLDEKSDTLPDQKPCSIFEATSHGNHGEAAFTPQPLCGFGFIDASRAKAIGYSDAVTAAARGTAVTNAERRRSPSPRPNWPIRLIERV